MFYTKSQKFGCLERANLDGTNQTVLVSHKIIYPFGLTLDLANEHVYWMDTYMDSIERVDYNGKNRWSLKKSAISFPILKSLHSITIFENTLFVSSWSGQWNQSVVSVNRRDSNTAKAIISHALHPNNLRVFHRQRQPHVSHPCENDGYCNQLCVTSYRENNVPYSQCMCAPGYRLVNKTQCILIKFKSFLIYAKQKPAMIKGISMSLKTLSSGSNQEAIVPILNVKWPLSLDYNVKDQLIYFGQNDM